jgi:Spy/CpxP family protein refolding chaperone
MKYVTLVFVLYLFISTSGYSQHQEHKSEYAGQEHRVIKSLSEDDIAQLKAGNGWGLAKAAELNGVPGPSHILDMKSEIELSDNQLKQIQKIFEDMQRQAILAGERLIEKEKELNKAFAEGKISRTELGILTKEIGAIRGELTFIHLEAHLKSSEVLSKEQINLYNKLRGYDLIKNPCEDVPEGHDPDMWRKHNNCSE